ncbi:MAG: ATP-binding protein [Chitinispirillales bacterium]|jgi:predicted AAA+ superfamily ATPase|nr:ATP-binding protein [Chitinispirillales bacterium]
MEDKISIDLLQKILIENQEAVQRIELCERELPLEEYGNYIFIGPRRAGKTFCLFQVIKRYIKRYSAKRILYLNFEDDRLLAFNVSHFQLILDAYKSLYKEPPFLFLDEIQNITGWEKFARRLADSKQYKIFITGSNAKMLSKEMMTTLGGRYLIKSIYPFSFLEYLAVNKINLNQHWQHSGKRYEIRREFDEYFKFGGFPELLHFKEKRMWLEGLYQKVFYCDLVARYKIRNDYALKILISRLAESVHTGISFNRMKKIIQSMSTPIGVSTIIEYVNFLEESFLIFSVKNCLAKMTERESQKKYYFIDNGLITLMLDSPTKLLENLVAITLKKQFGDEFYFARDKAEVDFYVPKTKTLIQAAYSLSGQTESREIESMFKIQQRLKAKNLLIITLDEERTVDVGGKIIKCVPVWKWVLEQVTVKN